MRKPLIKLIFFLLLFSVGNAGAAPSSLTPAADALYRRLHQLSYLEKSSKTIFGMQNAFIEGRGWRASEQSIPSHPLPQTDVFRVIGKDPSLAGYDFNEIGDWNLDLVKSQMREIHRRMGVITLSWHMKNPASNLPENSANTKIPGTVSKIIGNSGLEKKFLQELDRLSNFLNEMKDIPIIFRPFHEHNRSWFWWGQENCTRDEFISLWKKTINHLRTRGVNNILIAYSPINVGPDYLGRYPGDHYVDILATDIYFQNTPQAYAARTERLHQWKQDAINLLNHAKKLNKIPAIAEIGNESLLYPDFWTDYFGWPMQKEGMRQFCKIHGCKPPEMNFAYAMLWRNDWKDPHHFFAPHPGSPQNANFQELVKKNFLLFLKQ